MNTKFLLSIVVVLSVISVLIFTAIRDTKKAVVTVAQLSTEGLPRERVRLGARVVGEKISVISDPKQEVRFLVQDPGTNEGQQISVIYNGAMPDTLQIGRDVILEGSFADSEFQASSLMTQCPSKYEPPVPGKNAN